MDGSRDDLSRVNCSAFITAVRKFLVQRGRNVQRDRESMAVMEGGHPITYPQLTQAIVPWPFTVWATSESSFRWESPDVAADTHRRNQFNVSETQRTLSWQTQWGGVELQQSSVTNWRKRSLSLGWKRGLIPFTGRGLSYISFHHLTILCD